MDLRTVTHTLLVENLITLATKIVWKLTLMVSVTMAEILFCWKLISDTVLNNRLPPQTSSYTEGVNQPHGSCALQNWTDCPAVRGGYMGCNAGVRGTDTECNCAGGMYKRITLELEEDTVVKDLKGDVIRMFPQV